MELTEQERATILEYFKQVPFSEEDFVFFVLYLYMNTHYPNTSVFELEISEEVNNLKDALLDVFDLVRSRVLKIV